MVRSACSRTRSIPNAQVGQLASAGFRAPVRVRVGRLALPVASRHRMHSLATLRFTGDTLIEVYRDEDTAHWEEVVAKLCRPNARFIELTTGDGAQLVNVENVLAAWPAGDRERYPLMDLPDRRR